MNNNYKIRKRKLSHEYVFDTNLLTECLLPASGFVNARYNVVLYLRQIKYTKYTTASFRVCF